MEVEEGVKFAVPNADLQKEEKSALDHLVHPES